MLQSYILNQIFPLVMNSKISKLLPLKVKSGTLKKKTKHMTLPLMKKQHVLSQAGLLCAAAAAAAFQSSQTHPSFCWTRKIRSGGDRGRV